MSGVRFRLDLPGHPDLEVVAFEGRERISSIPVFTVALVTAESLDAGAVLGARVRLALEVGGKTRVVTGIADRFERGRPLANGRARYDLRIVAALSLLRRRVWSAVYQDLTTLEIAAHVLGEHGVPFELACLGPLPKREYCVQHQESDYDFMRRLFAEEGIAFRVDHPPADGPETDLEKVVVFDAPERYAPLEGSDLLVVARGQGGEALVRHEHQLHELVRVARGGSRSILLDDFDLRSPSRFAAASAPIPQLPPELPRRKPKLPKDGVFEHHGPYGENQPVVQRASVAREQLVRDHETSVGRSSCARLRAGVAFAADDPDEPLLSGRYAVVEVRHRGASDGAETSYDNRFRCVDGSFLWRPRRPAPRVRQSIETATVTGPGGEEIYTDALGRIKVEFHWDLLGKADDRSSCFVRVAQTWAGGGWGFQFIPRIGMEVLIAYLGGDPDRPVVVGCMPNATHVPPYPLPKEKTRSGIRTHSTPKAEGYNELSFEDGAGGEEIRLHAQRDLNENVRRNQSTFVGGDKSLGVSGALREVVSGPRSCTVVGPSATDLQGGATVRVSGLLAETVEGDYLTSIGEDRSVHITGCDRREVESHVEERVVGPWTMRAETVYSLVVGTDQAPGHAQVQVRGTHDLIVDDRARIEAHEGIVLRCGESSIEIGRDGITLRSDHVRIEGSQSFSAQGGGPAVRLNGDAEIVADTIKLYAKESSLEMDEEASLKGKTLYLNCKGARPKSEDQDESPETKPFRIKLSDERFKPYAGKRYQLLVEGERFDGTTSGDGTLSHDIPKSAKVGALTLWKDKYPTGDKLELSLVLSETPPIDTVGGVKVRLKNLGYYEGAVDVDEIDEALTAALLSFQRDHGLAESGQPDDETKGKISARHGH